MRGRHYRDSCVEVFTTKKVNIDHKYLLIECPSLALWQGRLQLLTMKVLTTFYRRMLLMIRPMDDTIPDLRLRLPVVFKELTEKDLPDYSRFRPKQCPDLIRAHLAHGDRYLAAWYEGRIVHAGRLTTGRGYVPYLRQNLILHPDDVYSHDSFTLPAYRGYGLAPARHIHFMRHYRQQGYRRATCLVAVENRAGLRVMQKLGYQAVGLYSCLRFGPWQYDWQRTWSADPLPRLVRAA